MAEKVKNEAKIRKAYCAYRKSPGGGGGNCCVFRGTDFCDKPTRVYPVAQSQNVFR